MLEVIRTWLNGTKEYYAGVLLFTRAGGNEALANLFKDGPTNYTRQRLYDELLQVYNNLKENAEENAPAPQQPAAGAKPAAGDYTELYEMVKNEADKAYKLAMNKRAVLFALAKPDDYTDVNSHDKITRRSAMAIEVVQLYNKASLLYDRADYALKHGRLPEDDDGSGQDNYANLPDELLKHTINNLKKNIAKIRKRDQTAERMALLQHHVTDLKKLEARWHLLKSRK